MKRLAFLLYALFLCSWFLHLPARYPAIGAMRIDLVLVGVLAAMSIGAVQEVPPGDARLRQTLWALVLYSAITIPLVEWPGSVVRTGFPQFFKAFVFYWFTTAYVTSPRRLKVVWLVFVACQVFRVLEPVYLHLTAGYWGSSASMADWETMDRLSGAPFDVVNPNGLAFVVLTAVPFLHYGTEHSIVGRVCYGAVLPVLVYALLLTGSRSGLLGLGAIAVLVWWKSRHKVVLTAALALAVVLTVPHLSDDLRDRYLSIFSHQTRNAATADQRVDGVRMDLRVALRRPLFGHGLGTSREANANFGWHDQPSHNLYVEILQELGLFGLVIFVSYIGAALVALRRVGRAVHANPDAPPLLRRLVAALEVVLGMNILFSFASFGLSGYEWYLTAGLTDVVVRLAPQAAPVTEDPPVVRSFEPLPGVHLAAAERVGP